MSVKVSDRITVYLDELNTSAEVIVEYISLQEGDPEIPVYYGIGIGKRGMARYSIIRTLDYCRYASRYKHSTTVQESALEGVQYIAVGIYNSDLGRMVIHNIEPRFYLDFKQGILRAR